MTSRIFIILMAFGLYGCEKWELERDNPLDTQITESNNDPSNIVYQRHDITSDDNNDGYITKGETIKLKVYLKNIGSKTAKQVEANFSTNSPYVSILSSGYDVTYGDIVRNTEIVGKYYYYDHSLEFIVSNSTPSGTIVTFTVDITDEDGNSWQETFSVTVGSINSSLVYSKNEIESDGNNDGYINQGETVKLRVYLRNAGTSTANQVKATFSSTSPFVSILSNAYDVDYGNMTANYEANGKYYYYTHSLEFTVSSSTPVNTVISFTANIEDEAGNTWSDVFTVTVTKIKSTLVFSKYQIQSDGNSNNQVNAGESVRLTVFLRNTGTSTAKDVTAIFSTTNPYVSITSIGYDVDYGDMAANYEVQGQYYYYTFSLEFTAASNTPYGTQASFDIAIKDEYNNEWNDSFTVPIY